MTLAIPNRDITAGYAGQYIDTINANPDPWLTGDNPAIVTTTEIVGAGQTIPARTPVKMVSGALVPATDGTPAFGITVYDITTAGGETTTEIPVYRQGMFNPDLVNWPASYTTWAKKKAAFEGAPSPTAIIMRRPLSFTPPAPQPAIAVS